MGGGPSRECPRSSRSGRAREDRRHRGSRVIRVDRRGRRTTPRGSRSRRPPSAISMSEAFTSSKLMRTPGAAAIASSIARNSSIATQYRSSPGSSVRRGVPMPWKQIPWTCAPWRPTPVIARTLPSWGRRPRSRCAPSAPTISALSPSSYTRTTTVASACRPGRPQCHLPGTPSSRTAGLCSKTPETSSALTLRSTRSD